MKPISDKQTTKFMPKGNESSTGGKHVSGESPILRPSSKSVKQQTTPSQQRRAMQLALARSAVAMVTALNETIEQAKRVGLRIDVESGGYCSNPPHIKAIYDTTKKKYTRLL